MSMWGMRASADLGSSGILSESPLSYLHNRGMEPDSLMEPVHLQYAIPALTLIRGSNWRSELWTIFSAKSPSNNFVLQCEVGAKEKEGGQAVLPLQRVCF